MSSHSMNPSKIIGIQFSILSPDEIRKNSVAEINSRDTYVNNKPEIGGLFDPRMGVLEPGLICPTDGLNYMDTPGYFGHIELSRPVFYFQYLTHVLKIMRCICFKCSKLLIDKEKYHQALKLNGKARWDFVFSIASKVSRCGDENENGCGCKQPDKIKREGLATIFAEWKKLSSSDEEEELNDVSIRVTPEMVIKKFRRISDDDVNFMGFSPVFSRPDWMVCQVLAVPPPAVRPSVKHDSQQRSEDDISHIIVNIIKANKTLQEKIEQNAKENVIEDWTTVLQYYIAAMVNNKIPGTAPVAQRSGRPLKSISERLSGKHGRVRGNLMGKRVDFSARSVIGGDPNLGIRQLGIPKKVAMNITYPEIVNNRTKASLLAMVRNGPTVYPGAKILEKASGESISLMYIDRDSIQIQNGDIVHRHILDGDAVLFNRQPTLHRMSMMCHIAKVMEEGNTFRINVADTKPYNADFDGDEMNMHMPQDEESVSELRNLAAVPRQIVSPASNSSIIGIFQDSLLGLFRITRAHVSFTPRQAMGLMMTYPKLQNDMFKNKKSKISIFDIISAILPPLTMKFKNGSFDDDEDKKTSNNVVEIINGKMMRGQLDKSVKKMIHSIFNDFGFNASADFIDNIQNIVTEYLKTSAFSVGISDLIADKETNDKIVSAITSKKTEVKHLIDQVQLGIFENNTGKSNHEEFETCVNSILNKAQEEAGKLGRKSLADDNRFKIMVQAGSKGSDLNIAQMISCLGQQNVDGKRIPYGFENRTLPHFNKYDDSPEARGFVGSSFIQGLTPEELFFHAMGGRTGLIDTAVKTSSTGYIQRRLIKGLEDLKVEYDMTVRNNMGKIIQFEYGDDSVDSTKVEGQTIPFIDMTTEEIYAHYQMPEDETKDSVHSTNYTKGAIQRMNSQKVQLNAKILEYIEYLIKMREIIIKKVFEYHSENKVNVPVHFGRIIDNVKNQLHTSKKQMVDITPLECFEMIEQCKREISMIGGVKENKLFVVMMNFYLSPKELLMIHRFNKKSLRVLLSTIVVNYKKSFVAPGEMVGMVAAQSIGEPTTQLTLNTFHFAGVASKSNATRGVPRIEEILTLSKQPKNTSVTIELPKQHFTDKAKAQQLKYIMEHTSLRDVVNSISICFDPDNLNTLIEEDKELISQYNEFEQMVTECNGGESLSTTNPVLSKWVIRFEFDREEMLEKNITMDDIHFAIKNGYKDELTCVFSDYNSNKLVLRIRLMEQHIKKVENNKTLLDNKQKSLDQSDEIYMLRNVQDNLLDTIILKGVKNIKNVTLRKIQNRLVLEDSNYVKKDGWVLDTMGTNLLDVLGMDDIDYENTTSNDIMEIKSILGIEAARQSIYNEMFEVMEHGSTYINYHHLTMLCDRMCCNHSMVSIFRHGINNDDIGPIAKASFEETPEMFLRAARHGEMDNMRGVSANVMCGQEGNYGTSAFQVILDIPQMVKLSAKTVAQEKTIESMFDLSSKDDGCAMETIKQTNNISTLKGDNVIADDDYMPDF